MDNELTFRKLTIFIKFMEKRNIAKTAEALSLSSVSVHRALHSLEETLRCPLFSHQGRQLVALPAATVLLEYSKKLMQLMDRAVEETRKLAGYGQGRLRLGSLYSLTLETVPSLIMGLKLRRPELILDLTMGSNQMLLSLLEDRELDAVLIAISESHIEQQYWQRLPLFEDDICLAMPKKATITPHGEADLRDYRQQKFVSLVEGFATYAGFKEAFHIAGFVPEIVMHVNDIFSLLSLVQAGVGLSLIPARMKKVYENDVQLLKLAKPYQMRQQIAIVFARNREYDPNLLALVAEGRMYTRKRASHHLIR